MTTFIAGYMPDHVAYRAAIPYGAFSVAAGLTSTAMFFYASSLSKKPMVALTISSCVLGFFASALFRATGKCARSAANQPANQFNPAQFRKAIIGEVGWSTANTLADSGKCCFKKLMSQACKASIRGFIGYVFPKA